MGEEIELIIEKGAQQPVVSPRNSTLGSYAVKDHFSLKNPSSSLQFGENENVVFTVGQSQIVLERNLENNNVIAKEIELEAPGLFVLRGFYTLIAFLFAGFMFVFCTQLILSLFLGFKIDAGLGSNDDDTYKFSFLGFVGTLFAIPAFTRGMANDMTLASAFVADTWKSNEFMMTMVAWNSVAINWLSTIVYVLVPFFVGGIFLSIGSDDWWKYTLLTWFICIWVYFMLFWVATIYHEVDGCLQLIRYSHSSPLDFEPNESKLSWKVIRASILMKIKASSSGNQTTSYTTSSGKKETEDKEPKKGVFTMFTFLLVKCGLYTELEEPKLQHDLDLVRGYTPYVTSSTWGLEKLYCRNRQTRYMAIVGGPAALNRRQVESSFACFLVGVSIQLFVFIAFMVWMKLPPEAIGIICAIYVLYFFQSVWNSVSLQNIYNKLEDEESAEGKAIYQAKEIKRITEPTDGLCWVFLSLEIVFMFLFPFGALIKNGKPNVAIFFIFVSIVTFVRSYLNSSIAIRELGSMEGIEADNEHRGVNARALDEEYREKNRLGKIVAEISSGRKKDFWQYVFVFFILLVCALFMAAVYNGVDGGAKDAMKLTTKFEYPGSNNLEYTSCSVLGEIAPPDDDATSLIDFTLLSNLAYQSNSSTNEILNEWFDPSGNGTVETINHEDVVKAFKANYTDSSSAVSYKFVGFPNAGVGVVAIRGTSNGWDALADAQLWSSAALAQWLRAFVPLGGIFTPMLEYLLNGVSLITTKSLEDVAYYQETTAFVNFVKSYEYEAGMNYTNIIITGHSLGGGLAMISGAQSKVPAIALSGPNAVLSRRTFSPSVSLEALDKYTFNIVPDRDIVPRLDDLAQNYQRIKCRTGLSDPISCHFGARSLCEVLLQCGSKGRPIPCKCARAYEDIYTDSLVESVFNSGETLDQECPKIK